MLDIRALRVFIEAAKTENFTEAGRLLNLTQPAVSMQIRSLENYLQVKLFERDGRSIRLTGAGQALVPKAQQIIQMAISTEESVRTSNGDIAGELVIGCSTPAGNYVLPHIVAHFQQQHPAVHVSIPFVRRQTMREGVACGDFDLGVTSARLSDPDMGYDPFFKDRLVLIAPREHPWAQRDSITAGELRAERLICREASSACRLNVAQGLAGLGVDVSKLNVVMEVGSPEALALAVEHDIGVSFVSLLAAAPRLALGRLAVIKVTGLNLYNSVELTYSCARPSSPLRSTFLDFVHLQENQALLEMLAEGHVV